MRWGPDLEKQMQEYVVKSLAESGVDWDEVHRLVREAMEKGEKSTNGRKNRTNQWLIDERMFASEEQLPPKGWRKKE